MLLSFSLVSPFCFFVCFSSFSYSYCSLMNIHPPSSSLCTVTGYVHLFVRIICTAELPHACFISFCLSLCNGTPIACLMCLLTWTWPSCLCAFPCMHLSLLVSGSSGGGERRPEHHPSGGHGTQSQCQRTGPDALPGRSTALPVHLHLPHMCL